MAEKIRPLDQIDLAEAWRPWEPSPADPWGRKWTAHLYRRAAFGSSREDLLEADRLGHQGTLDLLLEGRPQAEEILQTIIDVGKIAAARDDGGELLAGWWLYCMLQGGHPLREKLTLFWHNHFATSIAKVQNPDLMFRQNCLMRAHALGKFGPFLQAMSKDAAMLLWLDSNSNVRGRPNENYARELMELFSLGVGNYTEKDIREAARAFTGWHTDGAGFKFNAHFHDDGPKTILGQTGAWIGDDVVRILLAQPQAARFLVRKLYNFFISENTVPSDALLEPLCTSFRRSEYDIAGLVKTMLASRHFYSDDAFRQRVKWPVEYVLGAVQAVYRRYGEKEANYRPLPQETLVSRITAMGQQLFAPPNVKGWPGGRSWLNTSTVLERDNFAAALAMGTLWRRPLPEPNIMQATATSAVGKATKTAPLSDMPEGPPPPRAVDPARLLQEEKVNHPEDIVRVLSDLYMPGGLTPEVQAKLVAFVAEDNPTGLALDRRVREAVHAILTMDQLA
jgi:hypothetical protein